MRQIVQLVGLSLSLPLVNVTEVFFEIASLLPNGTDLLHPNLGIFRVLVREAHDSKYPPLPSLGEKGKILLSYK